MFKTKADTWCAMSAFALIVAFIGVLANNGVVAFGFMVLSFVSFFKMMMER